jgi:hypothetical protein
LKTVKGRDQLTISSRKARRHFPRIETRMSDIASATPGNPHFGKELRSFFENRHLRVGCGFSASDRGKDPSRSAAYHDHSSPVHFRMLLTGMI